MGSRPVSAPHNIKESSEQSPKIRVPRTASARRQSQKLLLGSEGGREGKGTTGPEIWEGENRRKGENTGVSS